MFKLLLLYSLATIFIIIIDINKSLGASTLGKYNVDPKETSVSGISSGAFMATQMQVAYSSTIKGAGIVAGGPYDCGAQRLLSLCMVWSVPPISTSISLTKSWSGSKIDDISNMAKQKVYMISGTSDNVVSSNVMDQLYDYYVTNGQFIPKSNVVYKNDLKSGHTFPTDFDASGNSGCTSSSSPFVANCGFDGAGEILKHIYGKLNARNTKTLTGKFIEFNQGEFINNLPLTHGMDTTGWVYVPSNCSAGQSCKLHIAFHGCAQNYESIGDHFIKNSGFIQWADSNNIIVLFPQTVVDLIPHLTISNLWSNNINACWDWIGWYGTDFDQKSGKQLSAIKGMIDRIASGRSY